MSDTAVRIQVRSASCPGCGAPIRITAQGITLTYSCASCSALIDIQNHETLKLLSQAHRAANEHVMDIPLESRGTLRGRQWQVIGFMVRSDGSGQYFWREYLLFNPAHGFRWLMEMDGHWSFVERIRETPSGGPSKLSFKGTEYKAFLRGEAKVVQVVGEFYWRVERGETVQVEDYVAPPLGLSREISPTEEVWSQLTSISADEVAAAFKGATLRKQTGVGPLQPNPHPTGGAQSKATWLFVAVILLMRFGLVPGIINPSEVLAEIKGATLVGSPGEYQVSDSFRVRYPSVVEFRFSEVGLSNANIAFDVTLFDEATGSKREIDGNIGYYEGSDSDGYWSEGSTESSRVINRVSPGEYRLVVAAQAQADGPVYGSRGLSDHRVQYSVAARTQPSDYGFTMLALLAVAWPGWSRTRRRARFEQLRWQNSEVNG